MRVLISDSSQLDAMHTTKGKKAILDSGIIHLSGQANRSQEQND